MKKVVLAYFVLVILLVMAPISATQASSDSPAAAFCQGGVITPFVFQRMDKYLLEKYPKYFDKTAHWLTDSRGFWKLINHYHVEILWDG